MEDRTVLPPGGHLSSHASPARLRGRPDHRVPKYP